MQIFSSLLFGVSASLDALIMGITYGIRKIHIKLWQNLFISLITLFGTCLSICFGRWQSTLLKGLLPDLSGSIPLERFIGSVTLILFGMYYLVKFMLSLHKKCPKKQNSKELTAQSQRTCGSISQRNCISQRKNFSQEKVVSYENENIHGNLRPDYFSLKDSLLLGFALSANNMGIGLGASIAGLSLLPAAVCTFLFSAVFLGLGNCLGKSHLSDFLGQAATPVSGLLLLGLGLCEWFF